jgi:hypothetical protein
VAVTAAAGGGFSTSSSGKQPNYSYASSHQQDRPAGMVPNT